MTLDSGRRRGGGRERKRKSRQEEVSKSKCNSVERGGTTWTTCAANSLPAVTVIYYGMGSAPDYPGFFNIYQAKPSPTESSPRP